MKIFLDTSALFKLFHFEKESEQLENLFQNNAITSLYLSEITKLEFSSSVWKKVIMKEINDEEAKKLLSYFENDYSRYSFISNDSSVNHSCINLLSKYGRKGLRTLDCIQLATAIPLKVEVNLFITYDSLLKDFFKQENLATNFPNDNLNIENLTLGIY